MKDFNFEEIEQILFNSTPLRIDDRRMAEIEECYHFLEKFTKDKVIYGINTGFGPMAQWRIDDEHLNELQYNIIRSHSTGAGEPLPEKCVRAAMLARLMTFMQAHSGVNIQTCELLVEFLNRGIYPVIPQHGSVGASGDLVQLAHIALALIGEGEVFYKGERRNTSEVFAVFGHSEYHFITCFSWNILSHFQSFLKILMVFLVKLLLFANFVS